jgi:hypothetical protein
MLSWEEQRELTRLFKPMMTKAGFKRHESSWYRFSQETIQMLDLQPATGNTTNKVYVNLGVAFRSVQKVTHFRLFDCAVYGRLDRIVPTNEGYSTVTDFSDITLEVQTQYARILELVQKYALPFLDGLLTRSNLEAFANSERSIGFTKNKPKFPVHQ